jgi:putative transcriptional regulator
MNSLKGHFLLASSSLLDPNFAQSVVLMVKHDEQGAIGLVLNRALKTTVKEACEQALELGCEAEGYLYQGGPCEGLLMALHTHESAGQIEVLDGVYFSSDRDDIEWLLRQNEGELRFFVGYSGWGPGQLESEMESGSWVILPAKRSQIFGQADWSKLIRVATLGRWIDPRRIPDDPSVN